MSICVGCRVLVPGLLWRITNWAAWDIWVLFSHRSEVRSLKQILAVLLAAETDAGRFVPWKVLLLVAPHMFCPRTERNGIGAGIKPPSRPGPTLWCRECWWVLCRLPGMLLCRQATRESCHSRSYSPVAPVYCAIYRTGKTCSLVQSWRFNSKGSQQLFDVIWGLLLRNGSTLHVV